MNETILTATSQKTGKTVLLAGKEVPYPQQREMYVKLATETNEEYLNVALDYTSPCKKPIKFITGAEKQARDKELADIAQAEADAKAKKAKKPAAEKLPAPSPAPEASTEKPVEEKQPEATPAKEPGLIQKTVNLFK